MSQESMPKRASMLRMVTSTVIVAVISASTWRSQEVMSRYCWMRLARMMDHEVKVMLSSPGCRSDSPAPSALSQHVW